MSLAALECFDQTGVGGQVSEHAKLDLGVVGTDEADIIVKLVPGARHERSANLAALRRAYGDVLQVGMLGRQASGRRDRLVVVGMNATGPPVGSPWAGTRRRSNAAWSARATGARDRRSGAIRAGAQAAGRRLRIPVMSCAS